MVFSDEEFLRLMKAKLTPIRTKLRLVRPIPVRLLKSNKRIEESQISLRVVAMFASLTACWVMLTNEYSTVILGINFDPPPSYYSPAYEFFLFANGAVGSVSVVTLLVAIVFYNRAKCPPKLYHMLVVQDMIMLGLLLAGWAAARAILEVGLRGNPDIGWAPIWVEFETFCDRVTTALAFSFASMIAFVLLLIVAAINRRSCSFEILMSEEAYKHSL